MIDPEITCGHEPPADLYRQCLTRGLSLSLRMTDRRNAIKFSAKVNLSVCEQDSFASTDDRDLKPSGEPIPQRKDISFGALFFLV